MQHGGGCRLVIWCVKNDDSVEATKRPIDSVTFAAFGIVTNGNTDGADCNGMWLANVLPRWLLAEETRADEGVVED